MSKNFETPEEREKFHHKARIVATILSPISIIAFILFLDIFMDLPWVVYLGGAIVGMLVGWTQSGTIQANALSIHEEEEV